MNQLPEALIPVDREKLRRLLRVVDAVEWAGKEWPWFTHACPSCGADEINDERVHAASCVLDNVRREWEGFRR